MEKEESVKELPKETILDKDQSILDSITISNSGSLLEDMKRMEIKFEKVPEIEMKKIIIQGSGNFLNLRENVVNIPVEMIVFPFFTFKKQNKKVNFEYFFKDLGVKMHSTLILRNISDKVFQPSTFEEKIYTYLISMFETKVDKGEKDEYIEFEIYDFITNFLGNKMNRTYYTKVEQALKNLKNTQYQFEVDNFTSLGKYKFEDEEFKLLSYQKLSKGKKRYYRVILDKNVRQKIKEKRYIKYNTKALLEILTKDPIAGRIYRYISKIRYGSTKGRVDVRALATIIPLQIEQVVERINKKGKVGIYHLSRMKPALKRIEKAFDVLKELGYVLEYHSEYEKQVGAIDETYYIDYIFNTEKDGKCHISSFMGDKSKGENELGLKNIKLSDKGQPVNDTDIIQDAEVINFDDQTGSTIKVKKVMVGKKENDIVFPEELIKLIKRVKTNQNIRKKWDKRIETKIMKIVEENGIKVAKDVLNALYNVQFVINTTLVKYVNGILRNWETKKNKNCNLQLFNTISQDALSRVNEDGIVEKNIENMTIPEITKVMNEAKEVKKDHEEQKNTKEEKADIIKEDTKEKEDDIIPDSVTSEIIEKAINLYCTDNNLPRESLPAVITKESMYFQLLKPYINKILTKNSK